MRMRHARLRLVVGSSPLLLLLGVAAVAAAKGRDPLVVADVRAFASEKLGLTIVSAEVRDDGEEFGLLAGVAKAAVGMQFEADGLRALIIWTPAK